MKEADIRPADIFEKYLQLSAADGRKYFNLENRSEIDCPACQVKINLKAFTKDNFGYVECSNCRTLYQSPRPPKEDFDRFYEESPSSKYWSDTFYPAVAESRREKIFIPRVNQISTLCKKAGFIPKVIIDVGAGAGIFLEEWKEIYKDSQICAIEPGRGAAQICRGKGIEVLETSAENAISWNNKGDLLVCFEVIEHVHDPFIFLKSLFDMVAPGGYILLSGLGSEGFDIQVLWESSRSIFPPHHINFISVEGFKKLFLRVGFTDVGVSTPGKLDVDIVFNAIRGNKSINPSRFESLLMRRDKNTLILFQEFLAQNLLSSHCWVWAKKPNSGK